MNLNELTIKKAYQGLKEKEFSSVELTKSVLAQIKKQDKDIHAYLEITEDLALKQAKEVDDLISVGKKLGPLAGIPVAIKDNILVEGIRCTAGSKILENYLAPYDATVTKKLKEAKAVIIGKTNLDEFAMGSSTENSAFGPTKNPHDLERVAGGSSGGSAAAVAAHQTIYALGSDTGGSIRQPASFCGVVGLKPSYGRVSRYGLIAMASSLDQIGPITKTAEDAEIVLSVIEGEDEMDSTSVNPTPPPPLKKERVGVENIKIGIPNEYFTPFRDKSLTGFTEGIDPQVEEKIRAAILKLEELGAKISGVSLPHTQYALACYYIIVPSEISANLARYDGIKYGASATTNYQPPVTNLLDVYLKTRERGFGDEVRRRIMLGTYTLSAGYYDAYYLRAQKVRTLVRQDFEKVFEKFDVLVTPTSPTPAFKIGEKLDDPLKMYLSDIYTVPVNLAGLPAISIPCGLVNGLPVGLQIIGKPFGEEMILKVAKVYEENRE